MMATIVLSEAVLLVVMTVSVVFVGIMAGFFFAYSVSVVLALDRLSPSVYTEVMQDINETVLNVVFGLVFFGAVGLPVVGAAGVFLVGDWTTVYGQLFIGGVVIYLVGTAGVTMLVNIPLNEQIAAWSASSPPDDWAAVRTRWARWNHIRTLSAIVSFVLSLVAVVVFESTPV